MSATAQSMSISDALTVLYPPDTLIELRVPYKGTAGSGYYFDRQKLVQRALQLNKRGLTVYTTLNVPDPALHARYPDSYEERAADTTSDHDIIRRLWLPFADVDPIRPRGISSTDAQHEAAMAQARAIRSWLIQQGVPSDSLLLGDSGNGGHVLGSIDLPNDKDNREASTTLVSQCIKAVAHVFSNNDVSIDTGVFNAGRIWKVYGTVAHKGGDTIDRPHRLASLLEVPSTIRPIERSVLEAIAQRVPQPSVTSTPSSTTNATTFDIDRWIEDHHLSIRIVAPYQGGRKWTLEECPFNSDHGKDSAIIQLSSGALVFKCLHNGCANKSWQDLRELLDPRSKRTKRNESRTKGAPVPINPPQGIDPQSGDLEPTTVLPIPVINADEHDPLVLRAAAWAALKQSTAIRPLLYSYGSLPTRLEGDDDGRPILRELQTERMRFELTNAARWERTTNAGVVLTRPPAPLVRDLLADPTHPFPVLSRIVEAPVFASTGELQTRPGYHPASRTYHHAAPGFSLPDVPIVPTTSDIASARSLILNELLEDFSFAEQADRANAVALFLLPYARDFIPGPTPLHMIEAPMAGSGKGLLASVILTPALGRPPATLAAANDDDEWRKRITAKLMSVPAALLIDNINLALDSGALSNALTATEYEDRLLGRNENVRLPVRCVWLATANNPTMTTEIARRCVRIRIQPNTDRPYELPLSTFRHPHLAEWTEAHRAELVHAALTLIRAWLVAGSPHGTISLGSYEHWAAVLGGILDVIGISGFLDNRAEFYEAADLEGQTWRRFVADWWEQFQNQEVGTGELFPLAEAIDGFNLGRGNDRAQRTAFGMQLAKRRDSVIGNVRVMRTGQRRRQNQWRLIPTSSSSAPIDQKVNLVNLGEPFAPHARTRAVETNGTHTEQKTPGYQKVHLGSQGSPNPGDSGCQDGERAADNPQKLANSHANGRADIPIYAPMVGDQVYCLGKDGEILEVDENQEPLTYTIIDIEQSLTPEYDYPTGQAYAVLDASTSLGGAKRYPLAMCQVVAHGQAADVDEVVI